MKQEITGQEIATLKFIGLQIKRAREIQGYSARQTAIKSGVLERTLSFIENGNRKYSIDSLTSVVEFLNIDFLYLKPNCKLFTEFKKTENEILN